MKKFTVFSKKVTACSRECADGYRSDKIHGLIYPLVRKETGETAPWDDFCTAYGICVYCREKEEIFEA